MDGYMRTARGRRIYQGWRDHSDRRRLNRDRWFHQAPERYGRSEPALPGDAGHYPYWDISGSKRPTLSHHLKEAAARRRRASEVSRPSVPPPSDPGAPEFEGYRHATCQECERVFWRRAAEDFLCLICRGAICAPEPKKPRKKKRSRQSKREPYRYVDPEAHLGPLLIRAGRGWRFMRDVKGFALLGNIKAGYVLFHEPWQSCWIAPDPETGRAPTEPWSIGTERRRMGIPADWARMLLDAAGVSRNETGGPS